VANRYFGAFQDGSLKVRGIEARRRDTPLFIAEMQMEMLNLLARAGGENELDGCLPAVLSLLRRRLSALRRAGAVERLLVQKN
jgi:DNA polymerase-2